MIDIPYLRLFVIDNTITIKQQKTRFIKQINRDRPKIEDIQFKLDAALEEEPTMSSILLRNYFTMETLEQLSIYIGLYISYFEDTQEQASHLYLKEETNALIEVASFLNKEARSFNQLLNKLPRSL